MPDDHSKLVPLLPIPNRTVKRLSADDSADSCVKVGHRQAIKPELAQLIFDQLGFFFFWFCFLIGCNLCPFGAHFLVCIRCLLVENEITVPRGHPCFDQFNAHFFNPDRKF